MATGFSVFGLYIGYKMEAVEIITGLIGGLMGFLGGVSFKVLEGDG
tara:strand:+ start:637 stop:774 length:138 start_codon:yes stop_codon:yes gene_type:complete